MCPERPCAAVLVAAALLAGVSPAAGAEARARVDVSAGGLSASGPTSAELPPARLSGRAVTVETDVGPFRVVDTRAGAPGWSLVVHAARPADALGRSMGAPLVMRPGELAGGSGVRLGRAAPLDAPRALIQAPPGAGGGSVAVTPVLSVTVPPDTPSGRYTSTLLVTVT